MNAPSQNVYRSAHSVIISPNATDEQICEAIDDCPAIHIPNDISCIYFLFLKNELVYIGQSRRFLDRLGDHCRRKSFDEIRYCRVASHQLDAVERRLIDKFKPSQNRQFKKPKLSRYLTAPPLPLPAAEIGGRL